MTQGIRNVWGAGAAVLVALALVPVPQASAVIMATPPALSQRVAAADAIVVGRIAGFEEKDISVKPSPKAPGKVLFRIAIIEVTEHIKGAKTEKKLRLAYPAPPESRPGDGNSIRPKPRFGPSFKLGQQGLFFLIKHHQERFFLAPRYAVDFVSGQNVNFSQDVALIRYAVKAGTGLSAGLQSEDPQERFFAAALLLDRYRTYRGGSGKTEAIDAKQSELILTALADADWNMEGQLTPWALFSQLGLSARDGWQAPVNRKSAAERYRAARTWLRDHATTYRILRIAEPPPAPDTLQTPSSKRNE